MKRTTLKDNISNQFKKSLDGDGDLTNSRQNVSDSTETRSHWPISVLSIFASLLNMAMPLVLVRVLDPSTLGTFKVFFLYLMALPPLTFISGVSSGLSYWAGRGERGLRAIRMSGLIFLFLSFLALAVIESLRFPIALAFDLDSRWVTLFGLALSLGIAAMFYDDAAIATGRIWTGAIFNSGFELLRTGIIVTTALMTRDLYRIIEAHIVVQSVRTALGYFLARRQGLIGLGWDGEVFRGVLRYAWPVSLAFVFGVGLSYSDQIILSKTISRAEFAVYAVCCLSVPPLLVLEASVTRVLIPQLSEAFAGKVTERAARLYRNAVRELAFILIPAVTGLFVFAEPIIALLFTETYLPGAHFLQLYAFWYLTLLVPHDSVARARGESKWILRTFIGFSLLTVGACFAFGSRWGATGVLSGLLFARFSSRFYTIRYLQRTEKWKLDEFLPLRDLGRMIAVSAGLGAVAISCRSWFDSRFSWFFVAGSVFTLAYFAILLRRRRASGDEPQRVLMLTPGLYIGGLERMILNLSKGLKHSSAWEPRVLAYDFLPSEGNDLMPSFRELGIPVFSSAKPPRFSLRTAIRIAARVRRDNVAVIHTHDLGALIYGAIAKGLLLGGVRLVHTQHSFVHLNRSWKYRYYEKFFARMADAIAVVSPDTRESYLKLGVPEGRIRLIPNGVEFPENPELDREARVARREALLPDTSVGKRLRGLTLDFWILYLARVHGGKGQEHALSIWKGLDADVRRRAALIFVGPETESGAKARLEARIEASPDHERIVIAGASSSPQAWVRAADLFLSCSEFEGMPLAPVEAVGSGVPAVLSAIVGHEFLAPYAQLYPLEDPQLGARTVERLLADAGCPDLRRRVWEYSRALRDEFTLSSMADRYRELYEVRT